MPRRLRSPVSTIFVSMIFLALSALTISGAVERIASMPACCVTIRVIAVIAALAACAGAAAQTAQSLGAPPGDAKRGGQLFAQHLCHNCHGSVGQGGERGAGPRI